MYDHAIRMYADANGRLADADILKTSLEPHSDSAAILRVPGLEGLLKWVIVLAGGSPKSSHNYS